MTRGYESHKIRLEGRTPMEGHPRGIGFESFFAARTDHIPHALAQRIAATLPDIAAATLTNSNHLLPKGFIMKVHSRGAVSVTGTNPNTPAESYTGLFDALTRRRPNPSSPVSDNPWVTFTQAPTAIELAIHSIPTHILPYNNNELYPFIQK